MKGEVMCMLTKLPHRAPVITMSQDLGITYERVMQILREIQDEKFRIKFAPTNGGFAVGVSVISWDALTERAERYWSEVYGSPAMLRRRQQNSSIVAGGGGASSGGDQ